ncbi:MAG: MauE/DoxX family redox-associated membrane protein, partial [Acidimicrobiales bacterium]
RWLARALPWTELGLGGLLIAGVGLPWTTLGAAGLVAAFTTAVALRLARGEAVPCGCFGETSPDPVGPDTLGRNAVLLGLAVVAVAAGRRGARWPEVVAGAAGGLIFVAAARLRPGRRR